MVLFFSCNLPAAALDRPEVLSREGAVDYSAARSNWLSAVVGQPLNISDRLRTGLRSRASARLANHAVVRINELTTFTVQPPSTPEKTARLEVQSGSMYFFSRQRPADVEFTTPLSSAAIRGTEFNVSVAADGTSVITLIDGALSISNSFGALDISSGEEATVEPGQPPRKTAVINALNVIQWCLYYPGVLDVDEPRLTAAERQALDVSLTAYRSGDLLAAVAEYPTNRVPGSDAEKTYLAALLLAVGQVDQAESQLASLAAPSPSAQALREVVAAVKGQAWIRSVPPVSAGGWLAESYYLQSRSKLDEALAAARRSVERSPAFGFGWARVAELEFSFGRLPAARAALDKALQFSPRNAQAVSLKGFLLAAQNNVAGAREQFDRAIALDGALGNAWLGRGLTRIHAGDAVGGRQDLQVAATVEPQRAVLRSYLGKAFANERDTAHAKKEFALAQKLDSSDPTVWLYSALLDKQENRFNEAVDDLEKSQTLNDNRKVYRSQMLLDQDRAVRSASLATIYQNAGMNEVSVREAARAVDHDYANYSAHLFLSDSFNALRDPTDFNLRYDTPWLNELLLANLLAPPGAGALSRTVSQHEYSKLFESDRFGLSTETEYNSVGQFKEIASHYANHGGTSYSLDLDYRHYDGVRPNNDLDRIEWFSQIKQQLTPKDSVMLFTEYRDYESGDNFQYYNPANARPAFRYTEEQKPNVLAAFRHEWTPDIQTLVLGGRLENDQRFSDANTSQFIAVTNAGQVIQAATPAVFDTSQMIRFEIWTLELNQIVQDENQHLVAGGKIQSGEFHTLNQVALSPDFPGLQPFYNNPAAAVDVRDRLLRWSAYAYYTRELFPDFLLTAGLSYEQMTYPAGFRSSPAFGGTTSHGQFNPKAALVWSPTKEVTLRSIYSRGLGGASFEQSFRLEPTELAGFVQSFGSTIPESVVGALSGTDCEIIGGALDVKLKTRTYFGIQAEALNVSANQQQGLFQHGQFAPYLPGGSIRERLDYSEISVSATVNQLLSDEWSLGASYRYTEAELRDVFPALVPVNPGFDREQSSGLHQATMFIVFNHPSGFFTRVENNWYHQSSSGYTPALDSPYFCQQNLLLGWRLKRQRGEIGFGILNLSDQDYRLNPLTVYNELPRERTYVGRVKFNF